MLEPNGTFFIEGKTPRLSERQHAEVLQQLEQLNKELRELRQQTLTG